MTTKERMVRSQTSSDLGERKDGELGDIDIVRATGMVAQSNPTGVRLWRLKYSNDLAERGPAIEELAAMLRLRGVDEHQAKELAITAVRHYVDDICKPCGGRGHDNLAGTPFLSDEPCVVCRGTGKKPIVHVSEWSVWLEDTISRLERDVAGAIMRKLADEMDF